jgi:hypothetical protein
MDRQDLKFAMARSMTYRILLCAVLNSFCQSRSSRPGGYGTACEAPLNKTYTYGYDYNPDDSVDRLTLPVQPGLNSEALAYGHDAAGNQTSMTGSGSPPLTYVPEARYTDLTAPAPAAGAVRCCSWCVAAVDLLGDGCWAGGGRLVHHQRGPAQRHGRTDQHHCRPLHCVLLVG